MSKLDTEKLLPKKPLQDGDKVSTVKKYVNQYKFALQWLLHESFDHRKVTIDNDTDWDDLKNLSSYYFNSLDGPNAPEESQLGSHTGVVFCSSAGIGGHFQFAFTDTGACFRDVRGSWFYIGHGIPANVDIGKLVDFEHLNSILDKAFQPYYTKPQVNKMVHDVYTYINNSFYTKPQIDGMRERVNAIKSEQDSNIEEDHQYITVIRSSMVSSTVSLSTSASSSTSALSSSASSDITSLSNVDSYDISSLSTSDSSSTSALSLSASSSISALSSSASSSTTALSVSASSGISLNSSYIDSLSGSASSDASISDQSYQSLIIRHADYSLNASMDGDSGTDMKFDNLGDIANDGIEPTTLLSKTNSLAELNYANTSTLTSYVFDATHWGSDTTSPDKHMGVPLKKQVVDNLTSLNSLVAMGTYGSDYPDIYPLYNMSMDSYSGYNNIDMLPINDDQESGQPNALGSIYANTSNVSYVASDVNYVTSSMSTSASEVSSSASSGISLNSSYIDSLSDSADNDYNENLNYINTVSGQASTDSSNATAALNSYSDYATPSLSINASNISSNADNISNNTANISENLSYITSLSSNVSNFASAAGLMMNQGKPELQRIQVFAFAHSGRLVGYGVFTNEGTTEVPISSALPGYPDAFTGMDGVSYQYNGTQPPHVNFSYPQPILIRYDCSPNGDDEDERMQENLNNMQNEINNLSSQK